MNLVHRSRLLWFVAPALVAVAVAPADAQSTTRVSISSAGLQVAGASTACAVSADGNCVVFESSAPGLVPGPSYGDDVYLRDRALGTTERITVDSNGGHPGSHWKGNGLEVSADGRYVAFASQMALVVGDTNGNEDVYVRDRSAGSTTRASLNAGGTQISGQSLYPSISADGRYVAFWCSSPNVVAGAPGDQIYVRDRITGAIDPVSVSTSGTHQTNSGPRSATRISPDGRFVIFASDASNLVVGDANGWRDVFFRDRLLQVTELISVGSGGTQGNGTSGAEQYPDELGGISADGRFVGFSSYASNLVPADTNGLQDVFLRDRVAGTTIRVSVDSYGVEGNRDSWAPSLASDGSRVCFRSWATNLVLNDNNVEPDVFMRDLTSARTTRVSVANGGAEGNGAIERLALSGDGSFIAFTSLSSNLVANDTNNNFDVFVHEPDACPAPVSYCLSKLNSLGCLPAIGATGIPSTTTISGFVITDTNVRNNKPGILLYSLTGRNDLPFQGGRLCIASTIRRTPGVHSGGTPAPAQDCSGTYSIDFATFAAGFMGGSPPFELRIPGTKVNCQWWGRDPGFLAPLDTSLSDGLEFFMCP